MIRHFILFTTHVEIKRLCIRQDKKGNQRRSFLKLEEIYACQGILILQTSHMIFMCIHENSKFLVLTTNRGTWHMKFLLGRDKNIFISEERMFMNLQYGQEPKYLASVSPRSWRCACSHFPRRVPSPFYRLEERIENSQFRFHYYAFLLEFGSVLGIAIFNAIQADVQKQRFYAVCHNHKLEA